MSAAQDMVGGRYRLLKVIGAGGMGRVWLADDELLRRRVAVKEIAVPAAVNPAAMLDAQLTTMREARAAARLQHPGVVGVYDVVWRPDRSWIVMEYVESRSLDEVVRETGPLPHREAARIGLGVLTALRAAHAAGVLHRDVKPHNVLLATDGRVLLTDFGLAKIRGVDAGPQSGSEPLLGSPYFVAPERLRGVEAGEAGDLWSLGATLYAAVEGRAPFQQATIAASLTALVTEPPAPTRRPGPLTAIIDQLLVKDPDGRLTAAGAQAGLQRVADRAVGVFPMRLTRRHTPAPGGTSARGMSIILDRMNGTPRRENLARSTKVTLVAAAILLAASTGTALALDLRPAALPAAGTSAEPGPAAGTSTEPGPEAGTSAEPVPEAGTSAEPVPEAGTSAEPSSGPVPACTGAGAAVTGRTQARGYVVPAGWLWHSDPTGFEVAVPQGWTRSPDGTAACFRNPGGSRSFRVDASARPTGTPLGYWQERERSAVAAGQLPGYQRVALRALPAQAGGAEWEFTWQPAGEPVRRHERGVLLSTGDGRAYLVEWTAPEPDWAGDEPYLRLVLASLS